MIAIIGGGASGVILAAHLLRNTTCSDIVLIEQRPEVGRGLAYSTGLPDHLLNVRAQNMSAFPDDPEHFLRWLKVRDLIDPEDTFFFAPRKVYGDYLQDLLQDAAQDHPGRLQILNDEAVAALPQASGIKVTLASGKELQADRVVLATGHEVEPRRSLPGAVSFAAPDNLDLDPDASVLILGTGLSMIDVVLSLEASGHRGPVTALSRRGLTPARQAPSQPLTYDEAEVPLGRSPAYFMAWLRQKTRRHEQQGGDWRDVVDGLRPFNQRIWQSWSHDFRRTFLRHSKAWWDVHRHRMAPRVHDVLSEAVEARRLTLRAAKVQEISVAGTTTRITLRPRGSNHTEALDVDRIYDCTGIVRDVEDSARPVIRTLVAAGLARADRLRLSLDVSPDCKVIARDGKVSDRIFAIGPLTRSQFFEIDAVPDIRVQCNRLARQLASR